GAGLGQISAGVFALLTLPNGDVIAGGVFASGGMTNIARWSGGSWLAFGGFYSGLAQRVNALATLVQNAPSWGAIANAEVVAAVNGNVLAWNGSDWLSLSTPEVALWDVRSLTRLRDGDLVAGGNITLSIDTCNIVRWNGTYWSPPGGGDFSGPVFASATMANGDLVVGGSFGSAGGVNANNVARWNGTVWTPLGSGVNHRVSALAFLPNGDLIAGGQFSAAGGVPATGIARWNGTTWSAVGDTNGVVTSLVVMPNGDLVASGHFSTIGGVSGGNIARWNGTTWSPVGGRANNFVSAMLVLPNGDLVAGGAFTRIGDLAADHSGGIAVNHIARYDGTAWSPLGAGVGPDAGVVTAIARLPNGDLVAGGAFTSSGGVAMNCVARWDGSAWFPLGAGMNHGVASFAVLPNGDLIAGGSFTGAGGMGANRVARWNGVAWAPLGPGTNQAVHTLKVAASGDLLVGGQFTAAGPAGGAYLARMTTTCPASAAPSGAGCSGSGGQNVLTAASLPWIGSTFRSVATGMPAGSLALVVRGFSPLATPLSAILPQGVAGCLLLASPDLLELGVPAAGILQVQIAIPNSVALATQSFREQVVALDIVGGSIVAVTSTNALAVTVGAF
ncbi:MAG TPA: hypothetical protein VFT55_05305, partial [Planctomycetota bacterium]|nr:hypothetical protein [Planctomycetota bacterium]